MLGRFALGSAAAVAIALLGGYVALRSVALDEARDDTRNRLLRAADLIEASLPDDIVRQSPEAVSTVDDLVVTRVLSDTTVRVKIWSAEGRVLYSDDPAQRGGLFALGEEETDLLRDGGSKVELSDLDRPENALDRTQGQLIEAYTRIRTPAGTPVLFEVYERFDSISDEARRLLGALAPPILGAIALIVLVQVPLVWTLTRRLQRGHEDRESLLVSAVESSSRERSRIASYLHDGAVQDVAGVAFALAPLADAAEARGDPTASELRRAVERLRGNVRDLRVLLVDLHPPNLAATGIEAALADLTAPLRARGVEVALAVEGAGRLSLEREALVYRVSQEALRNVVAHAAGVTAVTVTMGVEDGLASLEIVDDGGGFAADVRRERGSGGHLGLSLLERLVEQAGGRLRVVSSPGEGTRVVLEVPAT